ncbi:hypothetical protein [Arthrobacter livingstonensis]|uniref:hypothetical protein n=1 Tax=Arthrobacter livingstonensis TaxID=670078 RepID=UPI0011B7A173|nr:hypothetical protein [Arthrobacter livingstonensis]
MARYLDVCLNRIDFADPSNFDQLDALFPAMQSSPRYQAASLEEDRGSLAWGAAIAARAYLQMYRHSGNERYLRRFIGNAEQFLLGRDTEVDSTDYRGITAPAWRSGQPYTTNICAIEIDDCPARLEIRSKNAVSVEIRQHDDSFDLIFLDQSKSIMAEFSDLVLEENAERFVGRVLAERGWRQPLPAARMTGMVHNGALPPEGTFILQEQFYVSAVETGQICTALLEFCVLVHDQVELFKFQKYATRFQAAAADALRFHEPDIRPSRNGACFIIAANAPYDFESTDAPLNHGLSIARCYIQLAKLTNNTIYRNIAESLLRHFYADLEIVTTDGGEAYVWPYFTRAGINYAGYGVDDHVSEWRKFRKSNKRCEDASHAVVAIEAAVEGFKAGLVFDDIDMKRFSETFNSLMCTSDEVGATLTNFIDGSAGTGKYASVAGRWAVLAPWSHELLERASDIMNANQPAPEHATVLLSMATLATARSL